MKSKLLFFLYLAGIVVFTANSLTIRPVSAQNRVSGQTNRNLVKQTSIAAPRRASVPILESMQAKVARITREEGVNTRLFESLISQESGGRMNALSYKGARCLTQLMPGTARRFGLVVNETIDERLNIDKCLRVGARYLRYQLDLFGDVRLALAGYNAGEGAVLKFGRRIPPYTETIQYVEKICNRFYGQIGHGTAFAWNLNFAVQKSQAVYGGRADFRQYKLVNNALQNQPVASLDAAQSSANPLMPASAAAAPIVENTPLVKRTRVAAPEQPARVSSASLFFFNQK